MKEDMVYNLDELRVCVQNYEESVLNSIVENEVAKMPLIFKYKGVRRSKLVVIDGIKPIASIINTIFEKALSFLDSDNSLSDNIEVFTLSIISDSKRAEYSSLFMRKGLSLTITDRLQMESIEYFSQLFVSEEKTVDYDSSLYEYLSMSNETYDVKNSLFYALILMMVYQNQPVTKETLERKMREKYGKNIGDVPMALKALRRQKKISNPGKGGTIELTDEEKTKLEKSLKEERALKEDFMNRYNSIASKFGLEKGEVIINLLRDAYQAQYQWHTQAGDDEKKKDDVGREHFEKIEKYVISQIGDQSCAFIKELRQLCEKSDYLSRYSLSHSFLQLYHSSSYEEYINNKENCIYLDTPVVTCFLCFLSRLDDKNEIEWDNPDYQSVKSLVRLKETNKAKICFFIPYDYLLETVGELKKALQFSWFNQIDLAIPFETGNTFYNYYLFVKKGRNENGENVENLTFKNFVKEMGFQECDPDASLFTKHTLAYLKYFFQKTGNIILDPIKERFDIFDKVREGYAYFLQYKEKKKSMMAVNSDVRQALYIANETSFEENSDTNFFLTTWDRSLRKLRDIVNDEMILMSSYRVMTPANLANKLAFRNFKLSEKGVSDDVFAYADSGYNLVAKVQSLYDNVLTPYFANANNHNATLVATMLKMEKDCQDIESKEDGRIKENTVLADIFLPIVYALPENDLSTQNLREFLADENNNEFVINLLQEAFNEYAKGRTMDISERFCLKMKENLSKDDVEIKL